MINKTLKTQLKNLKLGDLVCISWSDASIGKSSHSHGAIEIPVKSWGIFVGLLGDKTRHIILAQNSFKYADGMFDVDYTAIPAVWGTNVEVIAKGYVPEETAQELLNSFLLSGKRHFVTPGKRRVYQRSLRIHGGLD